MCSRPHRHRPPVGLPDHHWVRAADHLKCVPDAGNGSDSPTVTQTRLIAVGQELATGLTIVESDAPATRRSRRRSWFPVASAGVEDPLDTIDDTGHRREQEILGDRFGEEAALIEVVRGQEPGWCAEAHGLDQGVEPKIIEVVSGESAGLEIDEHLARTPALGLPERKVDLAAQHDPVMDLEPKPALGYRTPVGLQRWPTLEKLGDPIIGLSSKFGPLDFGTRL